MHRSRMSPYRRILTLALLTLLAAPVVWAQEAGLTDLNELMNATTATFYDALPADDGVVLAETTAGDLTPDETLTGAQYVQLTYDDRSYLFEVAGVTPGKQVNLNVAIDDPLGSAEAPPLMEDAIVHLASGLNGAYDVLVTSRAEGDVHVVTGLFATEEVDPSLPAGVESGSRVALLRGDASSVHTVAEAGEAFTDVTLETSDGTAPLVEGGTWYQATGATAAPAEAGAADGDAAEAPGGDAAGDAADEGAAEGEAAQDDEAAAPGSAAPEGPEAPGSAAGAGEDDAADVAGADANVGEAESGEGASEALPVGLGSPLSQ